MSALSDDEFAAFMQSLAPLSQHLPLPPLFDATGAAWVIDPALIILKGEGARRYLFVLAGEPYGA